MNATEKKYRDLIFKQTGIKVDRCDTGAILMHVLLDELKIAGGLQIYRNEKGEICASPISFSAAADMVEYLPLLLNPKEKAA